LRSNGTVILLTASIDELFRRVSNLNSRPLLSKTNDAKKTLKLLWEERKTQYNNIANFTIITDGLTPQQVCNKIIDKVI